MRHRASENKYHRSHCLSCAYTDEYMQKPATHEGTVIGKKGNGTEPGTKLPHICLFQLILPIIAQLFPYRELKGELIIKVKLDVFKAGRGGERNETTFLYFLAFSTRNVLRNRDLIFNIWCHWRL